MKATSVASVGIVPEVLTFDNYDRWSVFMKNYLIGKDLWDVVIGGGGGGDDTEHLNNTPNFKQDIVSLKMKNAKALHIIQLSCGRQIQDELFNFEIARDAWDHLSTRYDKILKIKIDKGQQDDYDGLSVEQKKLFKMVKRGDSIEGMKIDPNVYDVITSDSEKTLLHIAVSAGNIKNVDILATKGGYEFVIKKDKYGNTAVALAAFYNAKIEIVDIMVDSEIGDMLLMEPNEKGEIPIHLAAGKGHKEMTRYLYSITPFEVFNKDSRNRVLLLDRCLEGQLFDVALKLLKLYPDNLFNEAAYGESNNEDLLEESNKFSALLTMAKVRRVFYLPSAVIFQPFHRFIYHSLRMKDFEDRYGIPEADIVKFIRSVTLTRVPDRSLHTTSSMKCWSPPQFLMLPGQLLHEFRCSLVHLFRDLDLFGISRIYYLKHAHYTIMGVFKYLMQNIKGFNDLGLRQASTHEAMLYAAKNGTIQFINAMREVNSDLLSVTDDSGRGIFWHAILNRRQEVFQLVYFLNGLEKDMFRYHSDSFDNELLNMAALFVPLSSYNHILCPVTEVQREWQWFQAVRSVVHPMCYEAENGDGKRPFEVFCESHGEQMKAAEQWTKGTATTYITVASLILTVMFAAAFTIPGGNNQQTGMPIYFDKKIFNMFLIADMVSIFVSASCVLFFIEILTSRYDPRDFHVVLPWKLTIGIVLFLLSICSMMVALYAALSLILKANNTGSRGFILGSMLSLGGVPVIILLVSQLRYIYKILHFTIKDPIRSM